MEQFLTTIVLVALLAAFAISVLYKIGVIEFMQINGNEFFSKLFNCQFCLCFWVNMILSIVYAIGLKEYTFLFIPVFSTVITRKLI